MKTYPTLRHLIGPIVLICVSLLSAAWPVATGAMQSDQPSLTMSGPRLSVRAGLAGTSGALVTVPIDFQSDDESVGSAAFSIDFDENCLSVDSHDGNGDGTVDAVRFRIPSAFLGVATYDLEDTDGELDITIADFSPPIATLSDQNALVEIDFTITCTPEAAGSSGAHLRFSTVPGITFGDTNGSDVAGTTSDGSISVQAKLATPSMPKSTSTPTAATSTPSATTTSGGTAPLPPTQTPALTPAPTATDQAVAPGGQTRASIVYFPMIER